MSGHNSMGAMNDMIHYGSNRTFLLLLTLIVCLGFSSPSTTEAANWAKLQGAEPPVIARTVNLWGFVQPTYFMSGDKTDSSDNFRKDDFNIRRARIGIRGVVPNTEEKVNYFVLTEWGRNGITENPKGSQSDLAALTDASVTLNYIPGARLRVGQFKIPIGIDGLQAIHVHQYIEFSDVYDQLMLERYGKDRSVGAYRDIGLQVFDWRTFGDNNDLEFSYSFMVANGNGINSQDNDSKKDFIGKITLAKVFDGSKGPRRKEVQVGIWFMSGRRTGFVFDKGSNGSISEQHRDRYGIDFIFNKDLGSKGSFRTIAEVVWGSGWVYAPKFLGGAVPASRRYFTNNTSVGGHGVPHANLDAMGWYVDMGYKLPFARLKKRLELDLRYSYYDPDNGNDLTTNVSQKKVTYGMQYFFHPRARVTLNYTRRTSEWDKSVGNRLMAQTTVIFK